MASHPAAETHIDRSLATAYAFVMTNLVETYAILKAVQTFWSSHAVSEASAFCFHNNLTDKVLGSLRKSGRFD